MRKDKYDMIYVENVRRVAFSRGEDFSSADEHIKWALETLKPISFGQMVHAWIVAAVGNDQATNRTERMYRFCEEALELVQACGMTRIEVLRLLFYVYGRPVGKLEQEVGGVCTTLTALCNANGIVIEEAASKELERAWDNIEKIRAKHLTKPRRSPLPGTGKLSFVEKWLRR